MTDRGSDIGAKRRARAAATLATRAGLALLMLTAASAADEPPSACRWRVTEEKVERYGGEGDVALESGAAAALVDLRIVEHEAAAAIVSRAAMGPHAVSFLFGADEDRWRRRPARVVLDPDSASPRDLATVLVAAGAARVDPGAREALCDRALLAREAVARQAGRGLWRNAETKALPADAPERLLERAGLFVIVEGVVANVGERARRTYIDFSRDWDGGFTVIVAPRVWESLVGRGLDSDTLTGRRIRVRGIIQNWRGPAVELSTADFIETMDAERRRR